MAHTGWETPDIADLLNKRQEEATTGANAGPYTVPIGTPLRRPDLTGASTDGVPDDIPDEYKDMLGLKRRKR